MAELSWNEKIIKEFRENGGKVGGQFEGAPMVILHTTGAKSGREHVNPLMYRKDGDRYVIFASKGGAPDNPDWYHNIKANPRAKVEIGTETFDVDAEIVQGEERDRLYEAQATEWPGFRGYEQKTTRIIPVIALTRVE